MAATVLAALVAIMAAVSAGGLGCACSAAFQPPAPLLEVSGQVELVLGLAAGDAAGALDLRQHVSLDVRGQIAPNVSVSGTLDNLEDGNLQVLELVLDGDVVKGRFGGVTFSSATPYASYTSRLRGVEVQTELAGLDVELAFGRVQGTMASKTFQGSTAHETITFVRDAGYAPAPVADGAGLAASIDGMEHFIMSDGLDDDFMGVWIRYVDAAGPGAERTLQQTLRLWNLGYLCDDGGTGGGAAVVAAGDGVALDRWQYVALSGGAEVLALRTEARDIIRSHVQAWIARYNSENLLSGAEAKRYPFIVGSPTEAAFLEDLLTLHANVVAGLSHDDPGAVLNAPASSYGRRRFYHLGQADVVPGSLTVKVRGGGQFFPVETEVSLVYQVFYDEGVIEFDFPEPFFDSYDAVQVEYRHRVELGVLQLGGPVAYGSEKVHLNGELLRRDHDYIIDYRFGTVALLRPIGPDDVLRVDYEHGKGAFGAEAAYKSSFVGGSARWQPSDELGFTLEVAHYSDDAKSIASPDALPVMPNSHTVVGLAARYDDGRLSASSDIAVSHDRFPLDDNAKPHAANAVSAVAAARDEHGMTHLILGHAGGFSAGAGALGDFRSYGLGSGLASPGVRDVWCSDRAWFFATDGGLSVVRPRPGPAGQSPFDFADNWRLILASDGQPSNALTAVAATPWSVWVGTADSGVAVSHVDDLEFWTVYRASGGGLPSDRVLDIAWDPLGGSVLVATDEGLASFDGVVFRRELEGKVTAVVSGVEQVGAEGLRTFAAAGGGVYAKEASGRWRLVAGAEEVRKATALAVSADILWIGTQDGLFAWNGDEIVHVDGTGGWCVTALGIGPGLGFGEQVLWAGTAARGDELLVFEVAAPDLVVAHDGRDLGVPAQDRHRYVSIPPDGHTATGLAGRANATYRLGAGTLYGSYEAVDPLFMRIGQTPRLGLQSWRIGGQLPFEGWLHLGAERSYTRTQAYDGVPYSGEAPSTSRLALADRISATIHMGPTIDLSYTRSKLDDEDDGIFDSEERTIALAGLHSALEDKLSVGAGYEHTVGGDLLASGGSYVQTVIRGDAALRLDGLHVTARFRRPAKTMALGSAEERTVGSQELSLNAWWARQLGPVALAVNYRQTSRLDLASQQTSDDRKADLTVAVPAVPVPGHVNGSLTPSAVLRWESVEPHSGRTRMTMGVEAGVDGAFGPMRVAAGAGATRTEYPDSLKTALDCQAYMSLSGAVSEAFLPQLDLRWRGSLSRRPDLGEVTLETLSGTARAVWRPQDGVSNVTAATYRWISSAAGRKHSVTASNAFEIAVSPRLTASVEASVRGASHTLGSAAGSGGWDASGQLKGELRYKLTQVWSLGVSVAFAASVSAVDLTGPSSSGLKNAFALELNLKASL